MPANLPNTDADRQAMLAAVGVASIDDLFASIPPEARVDRLDLPPGQSELEVERLFRDLAGKNRVYETMFRGGGASRHYIPAAARRITANETFLTAYTPYQPELSQGLLQAFFEYQTMICALTGMDAANASVYDGASAAAEAVGMCRPASQTPSASASASAPAPAGRVLVSALVNPQYLETIETYCRGYGLDVVRVPAGSTGRTRLDAVPGLAAGGGGGMGKNVCVVLQSPNYLGLIEDVSTAAAAAHAAGIPLVAVTDPLSLGLYESPGALGADICCGEGQSLGLPLAWGGPYLGFMACKAAFTRKLPGRIVGETVDARGSRAFVLTLQAREQHIRREKALSNICSNEGHCALSAAVYLAVMGEAGFREAARQCHAKAVYAAGRIAQVPGFSLVYPGSRETGAVGGEDFFNEFVTRCPDGEGVLAALEARGILGGLPLDAGTGHGPCRLLWAVTEVNTKDEIDELAEILRAATRAGREGSPEKKREKHEEYL